MKRKRDPLLDPLPRWKQRWMLLVLWWRRSRDSRRKGWACLRKAGRRGLTVAISLLGATLVSFGVWQMHEPAGYLTAGALLWAVQWNYGDKEGDG